MIEEKLKILGFTQYEIKVYLTLVKKGKLKAYEIVKEANVSSGKIYETLTNLEKKGLICVIPEKVNYYYPKPINNIIELIKKKEKELETLKHDLEELKEVEEKREDGQVLIARGKKNFHQLLNEIPYAKEYSYAIKFAADLSKTLMRDVKYLNKKGVDVKVLYDYDVPKENIKEWKKYTPNYKFIKSDQIAVHLSEKHLLISLVKQNTIILVKSKELSELMKQLFDKYYENS